MWAGQKARCPGSVRGNERESNGCEELFIVKRFGKECRRSGIQRGGTNQWIVLSSKDDDAGRRRNLAKLRLNLQAAHLRHTNIDQSNRRAMGPRILQELLGIAKRFRGQIS